MAHPKRDADPGDEQDRIAARGAILIGGVLFAALLTGCIIADLVTSRRPSWYWLLLPGSLLLLVPGLYAISLRFFRLNRTGPDGLPVEKIPKSFADELARECLAMATYALSSGISVPKAVARTLASLPPPGPDGEVFVFNQAPHRTDQLTTAHQVLSGLVAPATPRSLRILNEGSYSRIFPFFGRVRLVRLLMYISSLLLAALIVLAFRADFSTKTTGADAVFQAVGATKIYNALYLLSAAALGACFFALFKARRYINAGTYDPKYEQTYWVRIILGIIAGVILALLIPLGNTGNPELTKPLLALLGGFSAEAVYRILGRLVETLETLVQGSNDEAIATQQQIAKSRADLQAIQDRTKQAQALVKLKDAVAGGADGPSLQKLLDAALTEILPEVALESSGGAVKVGSETDQATAEEQPGEEQPAEEQPAEEQPAEEQPRI